MCCNPFLIFIFSDYTDGMRFYLIHMTEVRERLCVAGTKEKTKKQKKGFNVNSLFCLRARGAIGWAQNHITRKTLRISRKH